MQGELPDQGLLVPWTDQTSNAYGNIPLDESSPDLLAPASPSRQNNHHHQHSHLLHQQRHHAEDQKLVASPSIAYVTHSSSPYVVLSEADLLGHFEYANNVVPSLISHSSSEMRTGPGVVGQVEGAGAGRRSWKRKRDDENEEVRQQNKMDGSQRCDVCGEQASGHYFGALVCLPCKSFFIRCTKDGRPNFSSQCGGKCDVLKGGRVRCQHCRFQKCITAGMYRKEKPEAVEPAEGQLLCKVCGDIANGVHFGVTTCEGCKKFFRRGLKENRTYTCKGNMRCSINPRMRNNCRHCRYQKCLFEGMSREAIKMGRPKKGELSYRKTLKNNRMKPGGNGSYDKQMSESARSSMSSEYEQDDISTSDDVFDPMSSAQHQQLHPDHQHVNNQIQHSHPQQSQQQQSGGTFSLGSILHDCMTVQDWDQKVDITSLEHGVHGLPSHSIGGGGMIDEDKDSPQIRHSSPILLSEMLSRQIHQHQEQQQQQQQQQQLNILQHVKVLNPAQQRHHVVAYQVHNQGMEAITDMEFSNEHNLPINRAIKVENVSIQDGPDSEYSDGVVLENMRNLEAINKSDFQGYQIQVHNPNSGFDVGDQRTAAASISDNATLVSISNLDPIVSSQIVAINMSSQSVLYTPHSHDETIIIQNLNQAQHNVDLTQHQVLDHGSLEHRATRDNSNLNADQEIKLNHLLSSSRGNQITSQGVIRTPHQLHSISSNPQAQIISEVPQNVFSLANSNNMHQQFSSEITNVSSMSGHTQVTPQPLSPRRLHDSGDEANFTVLSPNGHHTITSLPANFTSSSQNAINIQHKISGIKSPIAAILQQHRNAIQEGRPIQLSPEEIEELLNTVNVEQQLSRFASEQPKDHRNVSEQNNIDIRRQSVGSFMVCNEQQQQLEELGHYNRQTPPDSSRGYHSISSQYQSSSPVTHNPTQVHRKPYQNVTSPFSNSGSNDRQDLSRGYTNNNNNNNNNQDSHYISPHPTNTSPNSQASSHTEIYEDSFNSSIIRDSTLLHEINGIFLSIDNSCNSYGCGHRSNEEEDNAAADRVIVSMMSADEFSPEVSHKYWHDYQPVERFVSMTSERHKIIQDVLDAFDSLQKTYMTNEPEYVNRTMSQDQLEHWHHIQRRIARHVVAGQRFCRNIPGYFKLDIQDRISLGKHVGFGLMVLIACTEFYDPDSKRFKHIWNWTMPVQNPLFSYKIHLLSLGDKIHDVQLDRTEASMICAISMTSIDCPGLLKPEIVCVVRDALIDALQAHISTKAESSQRLKQLLSFMPQVRLMTVWYNNLMKKMSLPSDVVNSKMSKARLSEAVGAENTPNFG